MKAIRVHSYGGPDRLVLHEIAEPRPLPGEVIVAVAAAGVNPADYKFRNGLLAAAVPALPFVPGMDIAGHIAAVGQGVTDWQVGDRVMAMLYLMGNGGYQEQVAVPADWCAAVPDGLDDVTAASLPTPAVTAVQWIEQGLNVEPGDRLLVVGAFGAVGRIACWAARERGAHVTAAVRRRQVDDVVHADAVLLLDGDEAASHGSFDAIADAIGGETATRLLPALKPGGTLSTITTDPVLNPDGLNVEIVFFGNHAEAEVLARAAKAVAAGELSILAPRSLPLARAAEAHERLERGGAGKIVLVTGGAA